MTATHSGSFFDLEGASTLDRTTGDDVTRAETAADNAEASAAAAAVSESNAATSDSSASIHAANALTSANNAQAAADSIGTGVADAQAAAAAAGVSESNAAVSESNAALSASNANTSETNAAASEAAAAASYDSFDDRYLGAKASAPTLDNDGDPLLTGALYFNSTDGKMHFYNGSAWVAIEPAPAADPNTVYDDEATIFTAQQNFGSATLTDGANIAWNLETQQTAKVTLGGNRTLDNPTNMVDGGTYVLRVLTGAGGFTLAFGSAYDFGTQGAPTITTDASKQDIISCVSDGTKMYCTYSQGHGV